jgi:hypothetical protein
MRISMNTASSGSGRIDDLQSHPQGGFRGQTKLVKITEDVGKYAAEQGIAEEEALAKGMEAVTQRGSARPGFPKSRNSTRPAPRFTRKRESDIVLL